jgi:hypothetical protein
MNSAIPPIKKLFQWATPHKKRIYYFSEGSIDEKGLSAIEFVIYNIVIFSRVARK